jgi:hypothetical protein
MSLGTADNIANNVKAFQIHWRQLKLIFVKSATEGAVIALLDIAKGLEITDIIDRHQNKRKSRAFSWLLYSFACNQPGVEQVSKNSFYELFSQRVLPDELKKSTKKNFI